METLFMTLSLNVQRGSSKEIWPLQGFVTVSLLVDLHPEKILLFIKCQDCQKCIKCIILGPKKWKLRSQKLIFEKTIPTFLKFTLIHAGRAFRVNVVIC